MAATASVSSLCISFLLARIQAHRRASAPTCNDTSAQAPFILGLNGVQGAGKTSLAASLHLILTSPPYNLPTVVFSLDDLYLTHADQRALAASHPSNPLLRHRGQPGTHDVRLGQSVLDSLLSHRATRLPAYDKSAFDGQGDRTDPDAWTWVNTPGQALVQVVVLEGWCVGFQALDEADLRARGEDARRAREAECRLWRHELAHLQFVNRQLERYQVLTE